MAYVGVYRRVYGLCRGYRYTGVIWELYSDRLGFRLEGNVGYSKLYTRSL